MDAQKAFAASASPSSKQAALLRTACASEHKPLTECEHGAGTASSVNQAQIISGKRLFPTRKRFQTLPAKGQQRQNLEIWFFCVGSADGWPGLRTHISYDDSGRTPDLGHGRDCRDGSRYSYSVDVALNFEFRVLAVLLVLYARPHRDYHYHDHS